MSSDIVYEKLDETVSVRGFITASVMVFDEAVNGLINRVFRKTDFAVQSVVDSLFETSGPLSDLSIRLKVLVGLGIIEHRIFEDIHHFIDLKEQLNNDEKEHTFSAWIIIEFARQLHTLTNKEYLDFIEEEPSESLLYQMKKQRREKLIRSCLTLSVTDIYEQLNVDSPL
ncbi:MltR family transcriptional regulator [Rodentibacter caecimuris]|uniref:MltR family transcriptional regulator n=1 Tax=Rodentibacter caecimuris TaxID=1796644 RepID=A0ABX3L1Y1_9PAST|nr:MltR family transcriptional regulator [Rodentibacter heylii]